MSFLHCLGLARRHLADVPQVVRVETVGVFRVALALVEVAVQVIDVIIEKVDADRVSIFYDQGSAVIDISQLSPDIQRLLNYDPDLAAEAISARQKAGTSPAGQ